MMLWQTSFPLPQLRGQRTPFDRHPLARQQRQRLLLLQQQPVFLCSFSATCTARRACACATLCEMEYAVI